MSCERVTIDDTAQVRGVQQLKWSRSNCQTSYRDTVHLQAILRSGNTRRLSEAQNVLTYSMSEHCVVMEGCLGWPSDILFRHLFH